MGSKINLRQQLPIQLVERMLAIASIREIGAEKLSQLDKKFHSFLIEYDDGTFEIDWEFCLFEATVYQFDNLFGNFVPKPKEVAEPKERIIIETTEAPKEERPGLITGI